MNNILVTALGSWRSSLLGVVAGAANALQASLSCEKSLMDWTVWVPSFLFVFVGALINEKKPQ
jgi:hypothetical protein